MEQEVSDKEQAILKIKLEENVRELIREEISKAFQDYGFVNTITNFSILTEVLINNLNYNSNFKKIMLNMLAQHFEKTKNYA
jgi:hypothetical protein